ncbi:MAG: ATP-binding protein, partial [Acidimicrobiales bacterium]
MDVLTAFVGREQECEAIAGLMAESRLTTVVGPAGVGKTRLVTELSARLEWRFPGGVYIVELSGFEDEEDIDNAVARQLDVDSIEALLLRSVDEAVLIVLDNCESALLGATRLANDLVERSEVITILATSRSPLQATHERVHPLRPLSLPGGVGAAARPGAQTDGGNGGEFALGSAAAQLFLNRARAAGAFWATGEVDEEPVGRLVSLLDGLPLAIELAAARCRVLSPAQLVEMLDEQLDILSLPGEDSGRHHSLRTAIQTSYQPLNIEMRRFFRHLSVLSAPFPLELAHAVTNLADRAGTDVDAPTDATAQPAPPQAAMSETLDRLIELVDASLIEIRQNAEGKSEYRLLDSIRAFAGERLEANGEAEAAHERYVDAMAAVADDIVMAALESFSPDVLGRIRDQFVHLANAIGWCLENDPSAARAYRMFIPFYGPTGGRAEVSELAKRVRRRWTDPEPLQAEAWAVMGTAVFLNGDYEAGAAISQEALDHPDATFMAKMMANRTLGYLASLNGQSGSARAHIAAAITLAEPFSEAFTRELRVSQAVVTVDPDESPEALRELEAISREAARNDELINIVWSAVASAYHRALLDDLPGARRAADAAVAVADQTGLHWSVSTAHRSMAGVVAASEGWTAARPHFRTALEATLSVGDVEGMAMVMRAAAGAASHVGNDDLARQLWSAIPPVRG